MYKEPLKDKSKAQRAITSVKELKEMQERLNINIAFYNTRMSTYYNRKHSEALALKKRDKVYLLKCNINTKQLSNKLDFKKLRLYKIKKAIGLVNFELLLLHNSRIHPIFYIALLELADNLILLLDREEIQPINKEIEYNVNRILNIKKANSQVQYLIK